MSKINLQELRFKLKDSEYYTSTKWIEISGVRCFVHPKSPGGWRRVMKLKDSEGGGPEWIIYYAHDEMLFDYKSALVSAQSYFKAGKVKNVDLEPDVIYVDPSNTLEFEVSTSKWSAVRDVVSKQQAFAVPKLQTLETVMSQRAKDIYKKALEDITATLLDTNAWTYDLKRLTSTKMYAAAQVDLTDISEPEGYLVLKAIKSFFEPSADQITYKLAGTKGTLLFIIEV
ncbi:hypothetical protein PHABIO_280 [Pseudomonas phage Phabio]|uniref:Uncharacterized protein n=1 Tax=Pseudomonas phage Phabio TaxID=2006668 RepID=A0A1Y0STT8_9CAUD|nr:hypothetical protein MZD05_gp280 [Pseudomonas phage Phabio]ARV76911.1 hypothetical protein PHABIO_280 [Pseudomonas phage Phabio]